MTSATFNQLFSYTFQPALFFSGTKVNPDIAGVCDHLNGYQVDHQKGTTYRSIL
jgi:hypothetical protein